MDRSKAPADPVERVKNTMTMCEMANHLRGHYVCSGGVDGCTGHIRVAPLPIVPPSEGRTMIGRIRTRCKTTFFDMHRMTELAGWSGLLLAMLLLFSACAGAPSDSRPPVDLKVSESRPVAAVAEADIQISPNDRAALQAVGTVSVIQAPGSAFEFTRSPSGLTGTDVAVGILLSPASLIDRDQRYKGYARSYVSDLKLVDPVPVVRRAFEQRLTSEITAERIRKVEESVPADSVEAVRVVMPNGLGIVVQTTAWQIQIAPEAGMGRQRVVYAAAAKAIQMPEGQTVWRATCRAITPEAISGDELRRDNGGLLKAKLAECASACADELWANYAGTAERSETPR
jgi:hypothetical protein